MYEKDLMTKKDVEDYLFCSSNVVNMLFKCSLLKKFKKGRQEAVKKSDLFKHLDKCALYMSKKG